MTFRFNPHTHTHTHCRARRRDERTRHQHASHRRRRCGNTTSLIITAAQQQQQQQCGLVLLSVLGHNITVLVCVLIHMYADVAYVQSGYHIERTHDACGRIWWRPVVLWAVVCACSEQRIEEIIRRLLTTLTTHNTCECCATARAGVGGHTLHPRPPPMRSTFRCVCSTPAWRTRSLPQHSRRQRTCNMFRGSPHFAHALSCVWPSVWQTAKCRVAHAHCVREGAL